MSTEKTQSEIFAERLQTIIREVLGKTLNMPDGEVSELLKKAEGENEKSVIDEILAKDRDRIDKFGTTKFQDGYKKNKAEILNEYEAKLKTKFEIDENLRGEELIERIATKQAGEHKGVTGKPSEEQVKSSRWYIELEQSKQADLKKANDDFAQQLLLKDNQIQKEKTLEAVKKSALTTINNGEFVLPEQEAIKQNQINRLLSDLDGYDYEEVNGNYFLMKDGKRETDEHGNAITVEKFTGNLAKGFWPVKVNNGGSNSGNNNDAGKQGGQQSQYSKPTSQEELEKIISNPEIPVEQKDQLADEFYNSQNGN